MAWIAFAVAAGAFYEAETTKRKLDKRMNILEAEIELLKSEKR
ncbi:hypothetical protein JOC95_001630 [Bacillus tianshenii]|uniref:Uncharacterized protein n=1 Tax=Sutcliffiella tianshenii TaxID=1463404 RepID=A0ABS2NZ71_9BACI|nr:hypothetical protein [Bacillus tianshenii]